MQCRSFAGEALERERFGVYVADSMSSGIGFANAKANLESLNRSAILESKLLLNCTDPVIRWHASHRPAGCPHISSCMATTISRFTCRSGAGPDLLARKFGGHPCKVCLFLSLKLSKIRC